MAKIYLQGKYGLKVLSDHINSSDYKKLSKLKNQSEMYLETNDGVLKKTTKIYQFKVINGWNIIENYMKELEKLGFKLINLKSGSIADYQVGSKTIRFYKSGGRLVNIIDENGNSNVYKQPKTAQQEDGVVWCLRNNGFDAKYINEQVGFQFDASWHKSFEKTYKLISSKINIKNYEIWRDSDNKKPKWLNVITDDNYLPDKKDNWNPADIWLVKKGYNGNDLKLKFEEMKKGKTTIYDFNELLEHQFNNSKLIGISLKKIESSGSIKIVKTDVDLIKKMKFNKISKKQTMSVNNSYFDIYVDINDGVHDLEYLIRFRPRGSSGSLNVYYEGKPSSRNTWDGAVSKDMLNKTYFKGSIDKIIKELKNIDATPHSVLTLAEIFDPKMAEFLLKKSSKYVNIIDYDDHSQNDYITKRGFAIVLSLYNVELHNPKKIIKDSFISAMKLNDFSSIHYKVS